LAQLKAAGTSFLRERPSSHRVCTLSLNSMTDLQSRSPGSHGRSHAWYSQARSAADADVSNDGRDTYTCRKMNCSPAESCQSAAVKATCMWEGGECSRLTTVTKRRSPDSARVSGARLPGRSSFLFMQPGCYLAGIGSEPLGGTSSSTWHRTPASFSPPGCWQRR